MHNKRLIITAICVMVTCLCVFAEGVKFTILMMNTKSIKIGEKHLKVGDSFTESDISQIKWKSDSQFLKARNEETKRTWILSPKNIGKKISPSLGEYLVKEKRLATRGYRQTETDIISGSLDNDTITLLPDTVSLNIPITTKNQTQYVAVWRNGDYSVHTPLPMSDDGQQVYITRELFGSQTPQASYVSILRYDLNKDSEPDSLGWLIVVPLPFVLE